MKTGKLLVMNLLVAAVSSGCSNMEEPVTENPVLSSGSEGTVTASLLVPT